MALIQDPRLLGWHLQIQAKGGIAPLALGLFPWVDSGSCKLAVVMMPRITKVNILMLRTHIILGCTYMFGTHEEGLNFVACLSIDGCDVVGPCRKPNPPPIHTFGES